MKAEKILSWQPFTSAPKTPKINDQGPQILIFGARGVTIGYWQYGSGNIHGWWVDMTIIPSEIKEPTHWMPLPEEPEEKKGG